MSSEKKINCLEIRCRVKLSDVCTIKDADIRDDFIRVSSFLENDFMKYLEWKIENFYLLPGNISSCLARLGRPLVMPQE